MGGGTTKTAVTNQAATGVPPVYEPAYQNLFNSAFGAARQAAGQYSPQAIQQGLIPNPSSLYSFYGSEQNIPQAYPGTPQAPPPSQAPPPAPPPPQQQQQQPSFWDQISGQGNSSGAQRQTQPPAPPPPPPPAGSAQPADPNSVLAGQQGAPQPQPQNTGAVPAQAQAQGAPQGAPPNQGGPQWQGAPPGALGAPQQGAPQQGPSAFNELPIHQGGIGLPGSTPANAQIPLAGGDPIVGMPYQGRFTANTAALEPEALMQKEQIARSLQNLGSPTLQMGQAQASGQFLNNNPFLQQAIQASLQPAVDNFGRSVAPQFASQAIGSGAYKGSSAREFALGNVVNDFGRNLAQTAGQIGFSNYGMERELMQRAPQLLSQGAALQQMSPDLLAAVGQGQRQLQQRELDEQLLQFQESQQAPWRPLGPLASIIQGTNIGTVRSLTQPTQSQAQGILQGITSGAALAGQLGGSFFGGQPSGGGAGGINWGNNTWGGNTPSGAGGGFNPNAGGGYG